MNDNLNHKSSLTLETETARTSGRRKFLTRAGTGIVIGALPAQSVWATTLMGSIIASGAGSRQGNVSPIKLQTHGRYKNHLANAPEVQKPFKDVFGISNLPFESPTNISLENQNGSPYYPSLWQIISSEGKGITLPSSVKTDAPTHVKDNRFDLCGPNNCNIHMITLYLNAYFYYTGGDPSSGVFYPVIGNSPGQFPTPSAFAKRLYQLVSQSPSSYGRAFGRLLSDNHA